MLCGLPAAGKSTLCNLLTSSPSMFGDALLQSRRDWNGKVIVTSVSYDEVYKEMCTSVSFDHLAWKESRLKAFERVKNAIECGMSF